MRFRPIRMLVALGLIGGCSYFIIGEFLAGASADAVVNAETITLRAPIDGEVTFTSAGIGSRLNAGQMVATLRDPRPDDVRLSDLKRNARRIDAEIERLATISRSLSEARGKFVTQAADYTKGRVDQLKARMDEVATVLQAAQARSYETDQNYSRATQLVSSGNTTRAEMDRVQALAKVNQQDILAASQRLKYATIEYNAAVNGVFLSDTSNDLPYSQQRIRDIDLQLADTAAHMHEDLAQTMALLREIDDEQVRVNRFREASLPSPASASIVWARLAGSGEYVRRGQDLVRLVDCSTSMVTASVQESLYNNLKVGDHAQFLLGGGKWYLPFSDQTFEGVVSRLAGSGAASIYTTMAVSPSAEHLKRYDVALVFPSLSQDRSVECAIGRTGRVIFSDRPLDQLHRLLAATGWF